MKANKYLQIDQGHGKRKAAMRLVEIDNMREE
jgi:hypothetical protein